MRAGMLRHSVTIQSKTLSQDSYGDATESWTTVETVRADVRMVSAAENFVGAADQESATVTHKVRMRYRSDVRPHTHRLLYDSRTLDIEMAEDPDGRRRQIVCVCREVVS